MEASTLQRTLARWGGVLVAPRRTVAALDATEGARDGLLLGLLYLAGTSVDPIMRAIAGLVATHSLVALAAGAARVLLTPVVVLVLTETLLGRGRSHRGGLALVPLVVVGTAAHVLTRLGLPSLPELWPEIIGTLGSVGLALWIRRAVPMAEEDV